MKEGYEMGTSRISLADVPVYTVINRPFQNRWKSIEIEWWIIFAKVPIADRKGHPHLGVCIPPEADRLSAKNVKTWFVYTLCTSENLWIFFIVYISIETKVLFFF